jgi:hypothetical protein
VKSNFIIYTCWEAHQWHNEYNRYSLDLNQPMLSSHIQSHSESHRNTTLNNLSITIQFPPSDTPQAKQIPPINSENKLTPSPDPPQAKQVHILPRSRLRHLSPYLLRYLQPLLRPPLVHLPRRWDYILGNLCVEPSNLSLFILNDMGLKFIFT